ncbi:MAG: MBL fold metallo-hydrolase [Candidatus Eisenbacteria bacterium]|nr:MBL fold metallo-hydrolase [Candidatus Eisenbacteria bacterium]
MKLTFYGAARTTTGSMHLVEADGQRILLDCGLYQGHRAEAFERNSHLPFDPRSVTSAILSHAHIDHSGNLPTLVKNGFAGEVNCTMATRDLAALMLRDSAHIQEQDAEYLNQKTSRRGLPDVEPLYTVRDAERTLPHLVGRAYDKWFCLGNTRVMMLDAGHILGSAIIVLELNGHGRTVRLGFTGDLGRPGTLLLRDPEIARNLDYVIVESTYGDREHGTLEQSQDDIARVITKTVARGGKVIIPSFAVERAQEVVYTLHLKRETGEVPAVPMFVDSPLAINATDVFRLHTECLNEKVLAYVHSNHDPFGFGGLHYTRSVDESKKINSIHGSCVIIAGNGMCEAGRIRHHLKNNIEDDRSTILFVGYQAENTLGRRLIDGAKRVKIFGDEFSVRAKIHVENGFSAHADRSELLEWMGHVKDSLKGAFVVHGEEQSALSFANALRSMGGFTVTVPEPGQTIEL